MRTFETEYQLEEWRQVQLEHFDSENKAYKGQNMSHETQEQMLRLINQLDCELTTMDQDEKHTLSQMDKMCVESLPPHYFEKWEKIRNCLKFVRKNLKDQ